MLANQAVPDAICHMKVSISHANSMWVPGSSLALELQQLAGTAPCKNKK